jgi:hypothetical protein
MTEMVKGKTKKGKSRDLLTSAREGDPWLKGFLEEWF